MMNMKRRSNCLTVNCAVFILIQRPALSWRCSRCDMLYLFVVGIVGSGGEGSLMCSKRCLSMGMQLGRLGSSIRKGFVNMVLALSTARLTQLTHYQDLRDVYWYW